MQDGTEFDGWLFGKNKKTTAGEVVFHTGLSGYQEIISDPSYAGQIITFTYPHIGNYGANDDDYESGSVAARGVIVRDYTEIASNFRSQTNFNTWLKSHDISGLGGIDTRKLTRHIRQFGSMAGAFGTGTKQELLTAAKSFSDTSETDLVSQVTTKKSYRVGKGKLQITAMDYGIKKSILNQLSKFATVTVMPANSNQDEILDTKPQGVLLSNGPGDPSIQKFQITVIKNLLGQVPIFGICLGHQLLATALGGKTQKLAFGHHGGNHPIKNLVTGRVEITSQNHNFAVSTGSLKDVEITHINLNDNVIEGLRSTKYPAFSVQYHPEAGPGPHESRYLFSEFEKLIKENQ